MPKSLAMKAVRIKQQNVINMLILTDISKLYPLESKYGIIKNMGNVGITYQKV